MLEECDHGRGEAIGLLRAPIEIGKEAIVGISLSRAKHRLRPVLVKELSFERVNKTFVVALIDA